MDVSVKEVKIESCREDERPSSSVYERKEVSPSVDEAKAVGARTGQNLSLIGLILSVFAGVGVIFCIVGITVSALRRDRDAVAFRYSLAVGIAGIVLSVLFAVVIAVCLMIVLR